MKDQASDLLDIIREEINLYRDLVEHTRRKTALLVRGSVDSIMESNKVEEAFNSRLRALESEMTRLCRELGQAFRIPWEEITLMKLAENFEHSLATEIRAQTALFRNIVRQLKSVTERNMKLVEKSMHYSCGLLALFSNASGSYRQNGLFEQIPPVPPTFSQRA